MNVSLPSSPANTDDDSHGAHHLIVCLLLRAARDAAWGSTEARQWLNGAEAATWAQWINLPVWPPTLTQLDALRESAPGWEEWAWARGLDGLSEDNEDDRTCLNF